MTLLDPNRADDPGLFANVDWSRTRAYGLGLNGLYVNVKGREKDGIVDPADREALVKEIAAKLLGGSRSEHGPARGHEGVSPRAGLPVAGNEDIAPDLIVGYAKGTRGSDESALGGLTREVFVDNTERWSGDHCMDHETVPGILLSNRPLRRRGAVYPGRWRPRFCRVRRRRLPPSQASTEEALTCSDHASNWTRH